MADKSPVRVLLVKDGENFYMRPLGDQPPVHIAFIDTAQNMPDGKGNIRALIPGAGSEGDFESLLDLAKEDMEQYVQSGMFDRDKVISAQNEQIRQLQSAGAQPPTANEA